MEINNKYLSQPNSRTNFRGYQHARSNTGAPALKFNYLFDDKKWNCEVQFFKVKQNSDYSYKIARKSNGHPEEPIYKAQLSSNGTLVENSANQLYLNDNEPVAYRYYLTPKSGEHGKAHYAKDDSNHEYSSLLDDGFNLITTKGTAPVVQGPMSLQIPDTYNPGYISAGFDAENTGKPIPDPNPKDISHFSRTFSNKIGGSIAGMEKDLPNMKKIGYKKAISTPTTGADTLASHKYWPTRFFQTENIDAWNSYMTSCYKNGISYVTDAALTSQGLEGVNFQYALKWMNMEDKPHEYYMFRMQGLNDAALGLGLVPANYENLTHKVVNGVNDYKQLPNGKIDITPNLKYDSSKPTYIQVLDKSLVSKEQLEDKVNLVRDYAHTNPIDEGTGEVNNLAINLHDDTLVPDAEMIDPYEYDANIKNLNIVNAGRPSGDKIDKDSPLGTLFLGKFSSLEIRPKEEGGFVCWDSNTDMAKLAYGFSDFDTQINESILNPKERALEEEKLDRAHAGNRDVLTDSVRYFARQVRFLQNEYTAKNLGCLNGKNDKIIADKINRLVYDRDHQKLPDEVVLNERQIKSLNRGYYRMRPKSSDAKEVLTRALMEYPLDAVELASDTVGTLSSPYISKRSPDMLHVGESRYDAMFDKGYEVPAKYQKTYNKMNDVYLNQMYRFASKVLIEVDTKSPEKIFAPDSKQLTEYGQYVVPIVAQDIAKYAIIKSLVPGAEHKTLMDGKLTYNYSKLLENASLKSIGVNGDSPEDEANQLINKMKKGIEGFTLSDVRTVAKSINKRIENTDTKSFRFAEAMVDKAGLGLEVRIDAAKDYADMDAVRSLDSTVDSQYGQVIEVLGGMSKALKDENPSGTLYAEFTDSSSMFNATYDTDRNDNTVFKSGDFLESKVLDQAAINTVANYSHFFTDGWGVFGDDFTTGKREKNVDTFSSTLDRFSNWPEEYKKNAYTFGGNHDKPRLTECFGMDMGLFFCNLEDTSQGNRRNREIAYRILNNKFIGDLSDEDKAYINGDVVKDANTGDIIIDGTTYFNNVSAKAIAKADWLKSGISVANNILRNKELSNANGNKSEEDKINAKYNTAFASMTQALSDVVNGQYFMNPVKGLAASKGEKDSYKKQLEKDGFGTKDVPTALDIVFNHAKHCTDPNNKFPSGIDEKDYRRLVMKTMLSIPLEKTRMYTQMIYSLPGNPTVFAGDDYGMTGYEEKCHNWWLNCRNRIPREWAEENGENSLPYIVEHKKAMDAIVHSRNDEEHRLSPLNGGTMYQMRDNISNWNDKDQYNSNLKCPTVLTQGADGSMVISIFNYNINKDKDHPNRNLHDFKLENENITTENQLNEAIGNYKLANAEFSRIALSPKNLGGGNEDFSLPEGVVFKNVVDSQHDSSTYKIVKDVDGVYCLKNENGGTIVLNQSTAPHGVMKLYYQPLAVLDEIKRVKNLENSYKTNSVAQAYQNNEQPKQGENLSINAQ